MVLADGKTFREKFGPRGVIHSWAMPDGTQKIEDTGPLTKKRMETVDDETSDRALEFIKEQQAAGKPWFVWWNGTRMHFRTHVKSELRGISGQDEYADGMVEHDMHIGKFLKLLDELGIVDNTIVFYSTDNGPHMNTWPDAAMTPFRGEKNTNWEGGWRVPAMVRWPGKIKAGSVTNEIVHYFSGAGPGLCGQFPGHLQGIPAAPEGRKLQPGPGDGKDAESGGSPIIFATDRVRGRPRARSFDNE